MEFHKTEKPLRGEITIPGDKSISHRSVMFGAISQGTTEITNFLQGQDCLSTISCFRKWGLKLKILQNEFWFTDAGCMALLLRRKSWMSETAVPQQG